MSLVPPVDAHVGVLSLGLLDDTRDGDRGSVDPGHKEPLEDGSVEPGVGPSGEEAVKLSCREKRQTETQLSEINDLFRLCPSFHLQLLRTNLDQQEEVRVLALGSRSVALPDVVVLNVDTHLFSSNRFVAQQS